jgi:hypothetical protein
VKHQVVYSVVAGAMTLAFSSVGAHDNKSWHPFPKPPRDFDAPAVFQAAGPTAASIQATVDQFRAALGGVNNGNVAGPLDSGRREINWDGGGSTDTSLVPTPFTGFLVNRGALFTTPGSGFVQAPVDGVALTFSNPEYATIFQAFSPVRLFSPTHSNVTKVQFFVPGGGDIAAVSTGFGAIFSDVDQPDGRPRRRGNNDASTYLRFYDASGDLIYSSVVPPSPGDASFSFFGIVFDDPRIAEIKIVAGDVAPGPDDEKRRDVVMMDDFIFGEPRQGK